MELKNVFWSILLIIYGVIKLTNAKKEKETYQSDKNVAGLSYLKTPEGKIQFSYGIIGGGIILFLFTILPI
jgi:hypothetical protein